MTKTDLPNPQWRWPWVAVLVFLLAAGVRAVFLTQVRDDPVYLSLGHDEAVNDEVARAILAGQMPPTSFYKAPLYMYALAGIYKLLGPEPIRARWVGIFVDSLTPVLLASIAHRLFGWGAGLIAGLTGALFWSFVFYSAELVDTSLACLLYLLLAYALVALPDGRVSKWLLCGILLGLGAITRPNILAFAPVLAVVVLIVRLRKARKQIPKEEGIASPSAEAETAGHARGSDCPITPSTRNPMRDNRHRAWRPALASVAALGMGCAIPIAPVTLHNRIVGGEWVPIATYGGLNFYVANSPYSDCKNGPLLVAEGGAPDVSALDQSNLWSRLDLNYNIAKTYAQNQLGRPLKMNEVDRFFTALTLKSIRSHPGQFLANTLKRFCWFFNRYEFPNVKDPYRLRGVSALFAGLSHFHYGVLCPVAVLGLILALQTSRNAFGITYYNAMLASLFVPGLLLVMNSRYRLPTVYLLVPFAAYGAIGFVRLWRPPTQWPLRLGACAVLAAVTLISNLDLYGYAKTDHTELLMTYAQGCLKTKRNDLLAEAARRFERAYWTEMKAGGRPWAATLHHTKPLSWLFAFYHQLGDKDKSLKYGKLMLEQEGISPSALPYYDLLVQLNHKEEALKVLNVLEAGLLPYLPSLVIEAYLKFWYHYNDPTILTRAEATLIRLRQEHPDNEAVPQVLKTVRLLLEATRTTSQPATDPTDGHAVKEPPP